MGKKNDRMEFVRVRNPGNLPVYQSGKFFYYKQSSGGDIKFLELYDIHMKEIMKGRLPEDLRRDLELENARSFALKVNGLKDLSP